MRCQVCQSTLKAGDVYCSSCGAVVPEHPPAAPEVRGRIAGERKYLTVLCADLQRSTDLISELDPRRRFPGSSRRWLRCAPPFAAIAASSVRKAVTG